MGTYNVPRNVKGEGRILFIFSTKSLIYTCVGAGIGLIFYFIFKMINLNIVGIVITLIFALLGYAIGMFKIPDTNGMEITRKNSNKWRRNNKKSNRKWKNRKRKKRKRNNKSNNKRNVWI